MDEIIDPSPLCLRISDRRLDKHGRVKTKASADGVTLDVAKTDRIRIAEGQTIGGHSFLLRQRHGLMDKDGGVKEIGKRMIPLEKSPAK